LQFIVTHQVFELWFKLLLHELRAIRSAMQMNDLRTANRLLRRVHEIIRILLGSFPLIETMRPADFLEIRRELKSASGFQSRQFREIEFISGAKDERYVRIFDGDAESQAVLQAAMREPSLWDAFVGLLARKGYPTTTDEEIVKAVIAVHVGDRHPATDMLVEGLLEYDLLFAQWRTRHVLMVERMIGGKPGTGQQQVGHVVGAGYGLTSGVDYLKTTLSKRFFPLLWQARTFLGRSAD
jgi:tryptophan 2,3-dioxygenase